MDPVSMKTVTLQWDEGLARQHRGRALVEAAEFVTSPPSRHLRLSKG